MLDGVLLMVLLFLMVALPASLGAAAGAWPAPPWVRAAAASAATWLALQSLEAWRASTPLPRGCGFAGLGLGLRVGYPILASLLCLVCLVAACSARFGIVPWQGLAGSIFGAGLGLGFAPVTQQAFVAVCGFLGYSIAFRGRLSLGALLGALCCLAALASDSPWPHRVGLEPMLATMLALVLSFKPEGARPQAGIA